MSLEEGYFLLKTSDRSPLSKDSGFDDVSIQFDGTELSFSSTIENASVKKINTKTRKGIEIWLEAAD